MIRLTFILTLWSLGAFGQCTNCEQRDGLGQTCYGKDKSETQLHMTKFMDLTHIATFSKNQGDIDEALIELNWLMANVPCYHICLYAGGERFINKMLSLDLNGKTKKNCTKTLKELKRLKGKHFGDVDPTVPCFYTEQK